MKVSSSRFGFSLLEVLVGAFLVTIVTSSLAALALSQERSFRRHRLQNTLRLIARSEMDQALSAGFGGIPNLLSGYPKTFQLSRGVDGTEQVIDFLVDLQYIRLPEKRYAEVILTVTSQTDPPKSFELSTGIFSTS